MEVKDLNQIYIESESALTKHFAEIRSNIRMNSGLSSVSNSPSVKSRVAKSSASSANKLKLVKNHAGVITNGLSNSLMEANPGVGFFPNNPREMQDQKAAELFDSVWQNHVVREYRWDELKAESIETFSVTGELFMKIIFDPNVGPVVSTTPIYDEDGMQVGEDEKRQGKLVLERLDAYDVLTTRGKRWSDCNVIVRKLIKTKNLKATYKDNEDIVDQIQSESQDDTFKVFNSLTGTYSDLQGYTNVREYYFRESAEYPQGAYFITAGDKVILEQGTLDLGFPILYCGYDSTPGNPRCTSILKKARPFQIEMNRLFSASVTSSILYGSDILMQQAGSKVRTENMINGFKSVTYTGAMPSIHPGRSPTRYIDEMLACRQEMYMVVQMAEMLEEKAPTVQDSYAMLFAEMKDKRKFVKYGEKLERFFVDCANLIMKYLKVYMSEEMLIKAIGRDEYVNVAEFKSADEMRHIIQIKPRTDDYVSTLGKQLKFQTIMQYAGGTLNGEQLGMVIENSPFGNHEEITKALTQNYRNSKNDCLALDRGETPIVHEMDDHAYHINFITSRIRERDFDLLSDEIKDNYMKKLQNHQKIFDKQKQAVLEEQREFIPSGGMITGCDLRVPGAEGKSTRLRLPTESLNWLKDKLEKQGTYQNQLQQLDMAAQAGMQGGQQPQSSPPDSSATTTLLMRIEVETHNSI